MKKQRTGGDGGSWAVLVSVSDCKCVPELVHKLELLVDKLIGRIMWLRPRRDPLLLAIARGLPSELLLTIYHQVLRIWLERPRYHLRERPRRGCSITVACAWAVFIQERQYYLAVDPATSLVGVYRRGVKPGELTVSADDHVDHCVCTFPQ